jgi:vacuolar-type H+-ATPase subunit F/Vma7
MSKARNQELRKTAILGTAHILQKVLTVVKNKKERTCIPIYVTIPADRNLEQKESENKILQESHIR